MPNQTHQYVSRVPKVSRSPTPQVRTPGGAFAKQSDRHSPDRDAPGALYPFRMPFLRVPASVAVGTRDCLSLLVGPRAPSRSETCIRAAFSASGSEPYRRAFLRPQEQTHPHGRTANPGSGSRTSRVKMHPHREQVSRSKPSSGPMVRVLWAEVVVSIRMDAASAVPGARLSSRLTLAFPPLVVTCYRRSGAQRWLPMDWRRDTRSTIRLGTGSQAAAGSAPRQCRHARQLQPPRLGGSALRPKRHTTASRPRPP
jgi:hypothetical protein